MVDIGIETMEMEGLFTLQEDLISPVNFVIFKEHTKETCYKLHGYPKKNRLLSHVNNVSTSNDSGVFNSSIGPNSRACDSSTNPTSTGTQGMSMFTHEQYNKILQMLIKGKGKEIDTVANVATTGTLGTSCNFTTLMSDMSYDNWIIDTRVSNHMIHNFCLVSHSTS